MNWQLLSRCQADAASGTYAAATSGFVRWLAGRYDPVQRRLPSVVAELRDRAHQSGMHRRTPSVVAQLAAGFGLFLVYAQGIGALSASDAIGLWREAWKALGEMAAAQAEHQAASEPTRRFLELLAGAVASSEAYVSSITGDAPIDRPEAWGWRMRWVGHGEFEAPVSKPGSKCIGWIDGGALYLEPTASYAAAQRLARDGGEALAVSQRTLAKRLHERGLLASTEQDRGKLTVRRTLQGSRRIVLHLRAEALMLLRPAQSAQSAQSDHAESIPSLTAGDAGPIPWAGFLAANAEPAHKTGPTGATDQEGASEDGPVGPVGPVPATYTVNGVVRKRVIL